MKKVLLFIFIICNVVLNAKPQNAVKTTLLTLPSGEQLVYGENCFNVSTGGKNSLIFTSKSVGGKLQFFAYENGVKKGPFDQIKEEMVKCSGSGLYDKSCARQANSGDMSNIFEKYITINQNDGKATINFNSKTYGPYYAVSNLIITNDNKKFYAIVMNAATMKSEFICSDGKTVAVEGSADAIYLSPDGNEAYMFQKGMIKMEDLINSGGDISKINMNDLEKVFIISISGKKLGPFDKYQIGDFWYCKSNNNLIYRNGYDVYVCNVKLVTLKENPDPCTFWLSNDNKKYGVVSYDKIIFNDGESFAYPLEVNYIMENGKTYLTWVALENETNLVLYKKEF